MDRRRLVLIDLGAAAWAVLWIVLALQVASEVRGLRDLSTTVKKTGVAVREAGEAIERLESIPLVGGELGDTATRVQQAGQSAVESGESSRESIRSLSVLLGIAIGVIPSVALLGVYLHVRSGAAGGGNARRRERRRTGPERRAVR